MITIAIAITRTRTTRTTMTTITKTTKTTKTNSFGDGSDGLNDGPVLKVTSSIRPLESHAVLKKRKRKERKWVRKKAKKMETCYKKNKGKKRRKKKKKKNLGGFKRHGHNRVKQPSGHRSREKVSKRFLRE